MNIVTDYQKHSYILLSWASEMYDDSIDSIANTYLLAFRRIVRKVLNRAQEMALFVQSVWRNKI